MHECDTSPVTSVFYVENVVGTPQFARNAIVMSDVVKNGRLVAIRVGTHQYYNPEMFGETFELQNQSTNSNPSSVCKLVLQIP